MTIRPYLAMTAWEFQKANPLPPSVAWMACHFSPYGTGLSNIPSDLPEGSILILNDRIPIHTHDPDTIAAQLQEASECLRCSGVLLDFQRPDIPQTRVLIRRILETLRCPTAVSDVYSDDSSCAVFLPPCPPYRPLNCHLDKWQDREIWLELSREATILTLKESGLQAGTGMNVTIPEDGFPDEKLHCHYQIQIHNDRAEFILWRDTTDTMALLREAAGSGVTKTIGLFQQFPNAYKDMREETG